MDYNQEIQEEFDRYINRMMGPEELREFEEALSQSQELSDLMEFHQELIVGVKEAGEAEERKKKFHQLRENYTSKQERAKRKRLKYTRVSWAAAAAVTAILIFKLLPVLSPSEIEPAAGNAIRLDTITVYEGISSDSGFAVTTNIVSEVPLAVYEDNQVTDSYLFDGKFLTIYSPVPGPFLNDDLSIIKLPDERLILKLTRINYRLDTVLKMSPFEAYSVPVEDQ